MFRFIVYISVVLFVFGCKSDDEKKSSSSGFPEIDLLSEDIEKDPNNAKLYFERAKLYYENEAFDNTILDVRKAMTIDSINPDFYHLLSDAYLDYYNSNEALSTMRKVLSIHPERVPSLLKMAELKYILEDYDGSILTVNEVIRIDPQNAEGFFMLGLNFRAMNDVDRALNSFQTAVEMDSGLTDAWMILGEMYEAKKDPKALKYFESAILSDSKSMLALHSKAFYLQNHGDINGAQEIYRKIIIEDKMYTDAYMNSGLLYLSIDSIQNAFEQFNIMVGVAPTNYMGYYMRGITQEKIGKKDLALKDYESSYNLNKEDKRIQEAIKSLKN